MSSVAAALPDDIIGKAADSAHEEVVRAAA
jgi:hypothetical protein